MKNNAWRSILFAVGLSGKQQSATSADPRIRITTTKASQLKEMLCLQTAPSKEFFRRAPGVVSWEKCFGGNSPESTSYCCRGCSDRAQLLWEPSLSSCFLWAVSVWRAVNEPLVPCVLDSLTALRFWRSTLSASSWKNFKSEQKSARRYLCLFSYCPIVWIEQQTFCDGEDKVYSCNLGRETCCAGCFWISRALWLYQP